MNQPGNADDGGDILPRLETMMESMTRSDLKIAKLVLKSPHEFVRASVRSVATDLGVSEPTVLRFCRTVGCEGFKDLKFRLIQELAHAQAMTGRRRPGRKARLLRASIARSPTGCSTPLSTP
jgi:RpiR family carbohydrate utilization transcriptional regulator